MCGLKEVALLPCTVAPCCEMCVAVRVQRTRPRGWQCYCFVITLMFVCAMMRTKWEGVWWHVRTVGMTGLQTRGLGDCLDVYQTGHFVAEDHCTITSTCQYRKMLSAVTLFFFLDHTQRHTTVGRTPLNEWVARRRYLYLTTHNRQASMPPGGFRTNNLSRRAAAYLRLDRTATGTGGCHSWPMTNQPANSSLRQHSFYRSADCLACLYLRGATPFNDTTFRKNR
jgi:hypothetical protein